MVLDKKKWKRLEDDIIKAGVMKYGTNSWSKISTLLQKKTPKECKERWKLISPAHVEFSEDEALDLLDLVRTLPNQWTAISKCFKNKSPHQCYEAYQKIMVEEARKNLTISVSEVKCLVPEKNTESKSMKVFNKKTGSFDITKTNKGCILIGNRLLKRQEVDYSELEEEEKDLVDIARARLQNTRGRKELKKKMVKKREECSRGQKRPRSMQE